MKPKIKQPDGWDIVDKWFKYRAKGNYHHVEVIRVDDPFPREVRDAAADLGRRLGKSIKDLVLSFNG